MNYTLNCPSLKHIALVKVATTLWNQDDIRAFMSKFKFKLLIFETIINEIENKVKEKVLQLSLPESVKEEILGFIKPVGLQILKWIKYDEYSPGIDLPHEFSWTPQGTVDFKKTAEALIKDESLDVTSRYKLACTYCLEDDVLELWNKIPENLRKSFYSDEHPIKVRQDYLVVLWTYNIKGEVNKLDNMIERKCYQPERSRCSPYQYAFETTAEVGNKPATEYFLQKLTSREREESLVRTAIKVLYSYKLAAHFRADVLCFLLSQMDEEQQIEVFKRCPDNVLKCLLYWPWQSLFIETANRVLEEDVLSQGFFYFCLLWIVDKVKKGYKDYDYQMLFGEFWQQSPNALKRCVINECAQSSSLLPSLLQIKDIENVKIILEDAQSSSLLLNLLQIEDKDNFKLIIKDATLIEKRKIIFSDMGQVICQDLIQRDEWDLLQFFIRECISSKEEMVKFKEEFEGRITWMISKEEFAKKKDKFFQLLDDFINGYNKRKSVAEGDSSPAKRLHGTEFEEVTRTMK